MLLSPYARNEWLTILVIAALLSIVAVVLGYWPLMFLLMGAALVLVLFFRDPNRITPTQRGIMVAPADGVVSSVHELDHFEPLGGPATCVRIFLSVFDVHINRSPCHGRAVSITHKPGQHLNAMNPDSAEVNESNLIVLEHPIRGYPLAAVRQVAGLFARTIYCALEEDTTVQRGQRIGIIKLGSTTELYIPKTISPQVVVSKGQKVKAGVTILVNVSPID